MILAECFKPIKQHQQPPCLTAVELPDCYSHIESLSQNERNVRGLSYNTQHRAPRPGKWRHRRWWPEDQTGGGRGRRWPSQTWACPSVCSWSSAWSWRCLAPSPRPSVGTAGWWSGPTPTDLKMMDTQWEGLYSYQSNFSLQAMVNCWQLKKTVMLNCNSLKHAH